MDYINKHLEESTRKVALLKSLPLYEFLLSIEKAYQENNELVSFSFKYANERTEKMFEYEKTKNDGVTVTVGLFENSIRAFPTDKEGIKSFIISSAGLHNISVYENKYSCGDNVSFYDFKNDFQNILKEFSLIENRELRFDIYKKFLHGKMPDYRNIIEDWRKGDTVNIIKKEKFINLFDDLDEDKFVDSLGKYITKLEYALNKFHFMNSFVKKKEMFFRYPELNHFSENISATHDFEKTKLILSNNSINYNAKLPGEIYKMMHLMFSGEHIYTMAGVRTHDINVDKIVTTRNDLFSDSPLLDFFKISKEEARFLDAMIEKEMLTKSIDLSSDNNSELKNKKRL